MCAHRSDPNDRLSSLVPFPVMIDSPEILVTDSVSMTLLSLDQIRELCRDPTDRCDIYYLYSL